MKPNLLYFNEMVLEGKPIHLILKMFEINFTNKDFQIWKEEGLIEKENIVLNLDDNDNDENSDEEIFISKRGYNSELYESINNKDSDDEPLEQFNDFFNYQKPTVSSGILRNDLDDIEDMKREILN